MKLTRITLLAALIAGALLAVAPSVQAQEKKEAPKREGRGKGAEAVQARLDQMATDLKLTEDQKKKVGEALKVQTEKMRELRAAGGTQEENRAKMRTLREDLDKKLKEILTAEQYEKWQKERPNRGKDGEGKKKQKTDQN